MMQSMILKALLVWMGIALAETLSGVFRARFLKRRLGDGHAHRVGVLMGSAIILIIGWFAVPWIGPSSTGQGFQVGILWLGLMLGFDIAFGRFVFHYSWNRIASEFDITEGNLLIPGMIVLFFTPMVVAKLRCLY